MKWKQVSDVLFSGKLQPKKNSQRQVRKPPRKENSSLVRRMFGTSPDSSSDLFWDLFLVINKVNIFGFSLYVCRFLFFF